MFEGIDAWKAAGYPVVPEAPPPESLILNPSVEERDVSWPYYWRSGKPADVPGEHVWSSIAANGSRALVVKIRPNPEAVQYHAVFWYQKWNLDDPDCPFKRGSTYKYRAWYQTDNATMRIYVRTYGTPIIYMYVNSSTPDTWGQSEWLTFTIPTGAQFIELGMGIQLLDIYPGESQALGRADDFEVQEVS